MTLKDFSPGQTVYTLSEGNVIVDRRVKSVGRKYVTLEGVWEEKFYVNNEDDGFLTEHINYGYHKLLFSSKENIDMYIKKKQLRNFISRNINNCLKNMSFDQLRRIYNIMEESK